MKIELEFRCTCTDGLCVWKDYPGEDSGYFIEKNICISMGAEEEAYVCPYLEAVRKQ